MLTLAQIAAIISLLVAFNVPQPTVNKVQTILNARAASTTSPVITPAIAPVNTPPTAPTFGATINSMTETAPVDKSAITVEVTKDTRILADYPLGVWYFKVKVLDTNGNTTAYPRGSRPSQQVSMNSPFNVVTGQTVENQAINQTNEDYTDFWHTFNFAPSQTGTQTITFTSGSLTKTITVDVQ